jgi:hypothetical protein
MAKQSGLGMNFYVAGYNLSGDVGSIQSISTPRSTLDKTAISSSAHERAYAHMSGEVTFNTHFNDEAGQEHTALSSLPTGDVVVTATMGTTLGDPAFCMVAKQINYDWSRTQDGDLLGTIQALSAVSSGANDGASGGEWCKMLTTGVESFVNGTNNESLDENGATGSSALGAVGYPQLISVDSGTVTGVTIEDSPNDSTWATLVTFDGTTAQANERITVTGNVDRWVRTSSGGTFTASWAIMFRRGTANDIEDLS